MEYKYTLIDKEVPYDIMQGIVLAIRESEKFEYSDEPLPSHIIDKKMSNRPIAYLGEDTIVLVDWEIPQINGSHLDFMLLVEEAIEKTLQQTVDNETASSNIRKRLANSLVSKN